MNRYILIIIMLIIYAFIKGLDLSESTKKKRLITTFSFFLILDSGLRNIAVGSDTYQYWVNFQNALGTPLGELWNNWVHAYGKDPFYQLFMGVFQLVFPYYRFFLIFIAIIFFWSLGRFIYRHVPTLNQVLVSYTFYLGLYYGFFSITGMRQTIATAIIMFAYDLLMNKKLIPATLLTLLAAQFHSSSYVFFLAFFIPFINIRLFRNILVPLTIVVIALAYIFRNEILSFMLFESGLEDRFGLYLSEQNAHFSSAVFGMYSAVMALVLYFRNNLIQNKEMSQFVMMYILGFLLMSTAFIDNTAIRITFPFTIALYVLIPEMVSYLNIKLKYAITIIVFMVVMIPSIAEYKFYWQPMKVPAEYGNFVIQEHSLFS